MRILLAFAFTALMGGFLMASNKLSGSELLALERATVIDGLTTGRFLESMVVVLALLAPAAVFVAVLVLARIARTLGWPATVAGTLTGLVLGVYLGLGRDSIAVVLASL